MPRIVLVRHESDPDDDRITTFLRSKNIEPKIVRPYRGEHLGKPDSSVVASVVYGGPFNVYEEEKHSFLHAENRWIEGCIKREIPLLGICQGAQSIARVLGAYAGPLANDQHEFGYYQLTPTKAGSAFFPENLVVAESHFHEFHVPAGGELLASSALFGQQAMKYGSKTFAFQFHAEVTAHGFKRLQQRQTDMYSKPGVQSRELQDELMGKHDPILHDWFMQFQECFFTEAIAQIKSS